VLHNQGRALVWAQTWAWAVATILLLAGCNAETPMSAAPTDDDSTKSPIAWPDRQPTESWMSLYIGDSKVGYSRSSERFFVEGGRELVETSNSGTMSLRRAGQSTTTRTIQRSVETRDGHLVRFRSEMLVGDQPLVVSGQVKGKKLVVDIESQGRNEQKEIDWNSSWGGLFAAQRSLLRKPMKPGQRRELTSLFLAINYPVPADIVLVAAEEEETALPDQTRKLQRIEMTTRMGDQEISATHWANSDGEILKSQMYFGRLQIDAFETTRETALEKSQAADFDLFNAANVRVKQRLDRPHETKQVVYRATLKDGDPRQVFPVTAGQAVEAIDEHTARITVKALRPDSKLSPGFTPSPPTEDDLQPNSLIQSDDRRIVALAGKVAPGEKDPWKIALALESSVHNYIKETNFSVAMATAAEVAQTRRGDCTEHAVLLAALCRARGIPARVAVGLVYFEHKGAAGFAYHMWTEVWINDRWIPIDATLGKGGIGAAHLTLSESNLKDGGSIEALLPVLKVIGDLKLEIVEHQ
jgi:hypothetical protein